MKESKKLALLSENDPARNTEENTETRTSLTGKMLIRGVKPSSSKPKIKVSIKKLNKKLEK